MPCFRRQRFCKQKLLYTALIYAWRMLDDEAVYIVTKKALQEGHDNSCYMELATAIIK